MTLEMLEKNLLEFSVEDFVERTIDELIGTLDRQGFRGVVFGASGGIDSLVSAVLCQRARGSGDKWPLVGLQMADSRVKGESYNAELYKALGVDLIPIDMTAEAIHAEKQLGLPHRWLTVSLMKLVLRWVPISARRRLILIVMAGDAPERVLLHYRLLTLLHRLRITKLKDCASRHGLMVVICANRTESSVGYFVEQGVDDPEMGDWAPIAKLYKSQVIRTAQFLGLPERVIRQKPSPGFGGIYDEEIIGPYELLDLILVGLQFGYSDTEIEKAVRHHALRCQGKAIFRTKKPYDIGYVRFIRQLVELNAEKNETKGLKEQIFGQ